MKKIFSLLLVLCMVLSMTVSVTTISAATLSASDDGVFWIEETDYDSYNGGGFGQVSKKTLSGITLGDLSGGDASYAWWDGDQYSYFASYKLNATTAGTYKIWFRGSDPANGYHDKAELRVNGTAVSLTKVDNTAFQPNVNGNNFSCAWFISEVTLNSGVNEITYITNGKATTAVSGKNKYACFFDCVVVAPSYFVWEKPSISTRPTGTIAKVVNFDSDGVAKIEETDYDSYNKDGFGQLSKKTLSGITLGDLSGGDASYAWWGNTQYSATYKLNATDAGTYKIWFRGSDPANAYYDKAELRVNGTVVSLTKVNNTAFQATVDGNNFSCAWFIGEVTLNSGVNEITYITNGKSTTGSKYACLFDCVVVAPSTYEWEKPSISTKPTEAIPVKIINFDADRVAKFEESDYFEYNADGFGKVSGKNATLAAEMSGGEASYAWWSGIQYSATYNLNVEKAGTYKIWYRGSSPNNNYHNKSKLIVNETEVTVTPVDGTSFSAKLEDGKTFECGWFVGKVTLVAGINEVEFAVTETATTGSRYACLFDCGVVAPATYVWETPAIDTLPQKPERLVDFLIDGSLNVGDTAINLTVYLNDGAPDMDATVIPVLYNSDTSIKHIEVFTKAFTAQENRLDISMTSTEAVAEGDSLKVFIWDNFTSMTPLSPKLTLGEKIYLAPFENSSFHIEAMAAYLNDSYENIANYTDAKTDIDRPNPIRFKWGWMGTDEAPTQYTLSVSENPDMTNAKEYTVSVTYYDILNLKVDTTYYWTVSAVDSEGNDVVSSIAASKTSDKAPRNMSVNGVRNMRDIGGWLTADGKQVKQGYLYRSGRLTKYEEGVYKESITEYGKTVMNNDLGIKTEIDIRDEEEMPLEYTESALGSDVNYVRAPMNYDNDYMSNNKDAIRTVFAQFADANNYPIVYHCSAGADRTGVITYLLNGLLGVSKEDLFRDYLITNFAKGTFRPLTNITKEGMYVETIDNYTGSTLSEKIYNYLNTEIGVSTDQLDFIIEFLK